MFNWNKLKNYLPYTERVKVKISKLKVNFLRLISNVKKLEDLVTLSSLT